MGSRISATGSRRPIQNASERTVAVDAIGQELPLTTGSFLAAHRHAPVDSLLADHARRPEQQ